MPIYGPDLDDPIPITNLLKRGLESKPDDTALVSLDTTLTWRELDESTTRLAAGYLAHGLVPGDRIASLMPNRVSLLVHYIACFKAGLVIVPLNYRYMSPEIDHALEVSGAKALLAHAERNEDIAASDLAPELPLGIITHSSKEEELQTLEKLLESDPTDTHIPTPEPSSNAAIFFTSGSTGPAKGVTHTHESLKWMFASAAQAFEFTDKDTLLPGSSISHLGGFLFSLAALSIGARVLVARRYDPDEIIPILRTYKPTVLCMIPAALFKVIRDHGATREDFSSLRMCRAGADTVPLELEKEYIDLTGHPIDEGYGSSEMGLATLNPPSGLIKIGSIGLPVPGFTFALKDDQGNEVKAGVEANAWVRSNSLMSGYWDNPESSAEVLLDGWFDTGDVLKADEDGYLHFVSRKKQIIVHDGSNISPVEVEESLLE
ncbi:MAG: class I adenylate-forming enzyme family protein, partial [Thermodesulfobacteriota bacterium]